MLKSPLRCASSFQVGASTPPGRRATPAPQPALLREAPGTLRRGERGAGGVGGVRGGGIEVGVT